MARQKTDRSAVLQFEFDRARARKNTKEMGFVNLTPYNGAYAVVRGALEDVMTNGGTLVVVATPEKITVVQRPDAEELDDEAAA